MITTRKITKDDMTRAAEINDAVAYEFCESAAGAEMVSRQLGVDLMGAAVIGANSAMRHFQPDDKPTRDSAVEVATHAFAMGVLTGLRAVEVVQRS